MNFTMRFAVVAAAAALSLPGWAQTADRAEVKLHAALKKETVDGDLKAAIEAYRKIATAHKSNRAVAAKALVQLGQCYEKLGDAGARNAYDQVIREYADQAEFVATARTRLAALARTAKSSGMTERRVFEDLPGRPVAVSSDGRLVVYGARPRWEYHVRDITTG